MLCSWIFQQSQKGNYVPSTKHCERFKKGFYSLVHSRGIRNFFFWPLLHRSIKEVTDLIYHIDFFFLRIVWWEDLGLCDYCCLYGDTSSFSVQILSADEWGLTVWDKKPSLTTPALWESPLLSMKCCRSSHACTKTFSWIKWKERSHTTKQKCWSSRACLGNPKPRSWTANLGCTWNYISRRGQWPRCCVAAGMDFFPLPGIIPNNETLNNVTHLQHRTTRHKHQS